MHTCCMQPWPACSVCLAASRHALAGSGTPFPCRVTPCVAGLVNADEPELAAGLVAALGADLAAAFAPGGDARRARLLLRFASALVPVNVLHAASLLGALRGLVGTAQAMADASKWGTSCKAA